MLGLLLCLKSILRLRYDSGQRAFKHKLTQVGKLHPTPYLLFVSNKSENNGIIKA